MKFNEKIVILFPLVHYGIVDGLLSRCFVEIDDEHDSDGKRWWYGDVTIGLDEDGNEFPYTITANGLVSDDGQPTTDGLWLSVDTDYDRNSFKIISGIRIDECV